MVRGALSRLEAELAGRGLLRVHRSWIVNLAHVRRFVAQASGEFRFEMADGQMVPATRRHGDTVHRVTHPLSVRQP
jgi:DNA-binding LytR/AlgR family response regulator